MDIKRDGGNLRKTNLYSYPDVNGRYRLLFQFQNSKKEAIYWQLTKNQVENRKKQQSWMDQKIWKGSSVYADGLEIDLEK